MKLDEPAPGIISPVVDADAGADEDMSWARAMAARPARESEVAEYFMVVDVVVYVGRSGLVIIVCGLLISRGISSGKY